MTRASVVVLAAALVAAPWAGHIDDTDAQLYQVLARNMASSHRWLEPGLPPASATPYREHLPFGLWPYAAAVRAFGERSLRWCGALFSLLTIASLIGLVGGGAGIASALVLGMTETFFLYGGRPRLDPPLVFFATLSGLFVLRERPNWFLATASASLATLVKGPFGLVPLACAAAARSIADRDARVLLRGVGATLLAALPATLFIASADSTWRQGYLGAQLVASATGARNDGSMAPWAALASIAGRFWPGLPFAIVAAFDRRHRAVALTCALLLVALSLPARKVWNHQLIAYPFLSLLAGLWLAPHLARWMRFVPALAAVAAILAASGLGRRLLRPPCVASREFASLMPQQGTPILVVSEPPDWRTLVGLAAEQRLAPVLAASLDQGSAQAPHVAIVQDSLFSPGPWREIARARGWVFAAR